MPYQCSSDTLYVKARAGHSSHAGFSAANCVDWCPKTRCSSISTPNLWTLQDLRSVKQRGGGKCGNPGKSDVWFFCKLRGGRIQLQESSRIQIWKSDSKIKLLWKIKSYCLLTRVFGWKIIPQKWIWWLLTKQKLWECTESDLTQVSGSGRTAPRKQHWSWNLPHRNATWTLSVWSLSKGTDIFPSR